VREAQTSHQLSAISFSHQLSAISSQDLTTDTQTLC